MTQGTSASCTAFASAAAGASLDVSTAVDDIADLGGDSRDD